MNFADCYRLLGLRSGASQAEIKASYRRLARQYHPDFNPGDQQAEDKFVQITEAYKYLLSNVQDSEVSNGVSQSKEVHVYRKEPPVNEVIENESEAEEAVPLSTVEFDLKWTSYQQLQNLLKSRRFARAIALVEGLAQRLPQDKEVRQWQAIAYQRWGRQLVSEKQLDKARIYLKKALKTDPHNRSLWAEVEEDFRKIEQIFR